MMNFLLGATAGALIACVGTITALRHPDLQVRLGLRPAAVAAAPAPRPPEPVCPPPAAEHAVGTTEMLLSPRRFWSIAPDKRPQ